MSYQEAVNYNTLNWIELDAKEALEELLTRDEHRAWRQYQPLRSFPVYLYWPNDPRYIVPDQPAKEAR